MSLHELDMTSIRLRMDDSPQTGDTSKMHATVRCVCGMQFSTSGVTAAELTDQLLEMYREHCKEMDQSDDTGAAA